MSDTPETDAVVWSKTGNLQPICEKLERERDKLRAEVAALKADRERYAAVFQRIAKSAGIESPLELIAKAENDEQNYAEILAGCVEARFTALNADKARLDWIEAQMDRQFHFAVRYWDHDGRRIMNTGMNVLKMFKRGGDDETLREALDAAMKGAE